MILKARKELNKLFKRKGDQLPSVIIVGAQKAGTSSLFNYLKQHPDVLVSFNKEVHFYDHDFRYNRGLKWYKNQFPKTNGQSVLLEATPRYLYVKSVAKRITESIPDVKIIVMIREPIARAFSAWNMYRHFFKSVVFRPKMMENLASGQFINEFFDDKSLPDFATIVKRELKYLDENPDFDYEPSFIKRGFYKDQILNWCEYIDKSNIHFIQMEKMHSKKALNNILYEVCDFINIECNSSYIENLKDKVVNKRQYNGKLQDHVDEGLMNQLFHFYQEKNKGLDEIIGQEISWLQANDKI
jgi:hypothetical protein